MVKTRVRAVLVNAVQQHLASAEMLACTHELVSTQVAELPPALDRTLVPAVLLAVRARGLALDGVVLACRGVLHPHTARVDGDNDGLTSVLV